MVASAVGEVAPRGGVTMCSSEDGGVEDSVAGWEVLAVAACLMTSVRLWRGVVLWTPAPQAVRAEAGSRWPVFEGQGHRAPRWALRLVWLWWPARRAPDAAPGLEGSEDKMAAAWRKKKMAVARLLMGADG